MALSILSLGMLTPLPLSMARRRRGLKLASPPPILAATVISLAILEKAAPRFSSWRPLRCWILAHLECPDMLTSSLCGAVRRLFAEAAVRAEKASILPLSPAARPRFSPAAEGFAVEKQHLPQRRRVTEEAQRKALALKSLVSA